MKLKICLLQLLIILFSIRIYSQTSIDGEIRPRSEFRQGFRKPLADSLNPAFVTLQRTRLSADYKSKVLNARITLQDSRIWGKSDTKTNDSKLEIYEAWAEYLITSGLSAQFGRQALKYDDQRLLGAAAWSNTGLAHDLFLLKYKPYSNGQVHMGLAYNNSKDTLLEVNYSTRQMYKTMGFLWLSKSLSNGLTITAIAVEEGLQKTKNYQVIYPRFTCGSNICFLNDSSNFSFNALGYYQTGKSSTFDDLNAFMFAAKAGYKFYNFCTIFIGTDYYSGTKTDATSGTSSTFNKLYGANHSFNGNMEYWTSIPKCGLADYYGGITAKISPKLSADVTYHMFCLAQKYIINSMEIDKNMGSEMDMILNYPISKEIAFQAGYCTYFNSNSTDEYFKMSNIDIHQSQWAYIMLTVKPNFYKTPTESK